LTELNDPIGAEPEEGVVGGPWLDDDRSRAASSALLFGIGLLMAGNGLQGSLLSVRAEAEGFGLAVSGFVMAGYFAGFLIGPSVTERLLSTVGHIRVFAALASVASSAVLMHLVSVTPVMWTAMRVVFGFCMAGSYVVAESWLNDMATNATRGRLLATYMIMTMGGLAVGQLLLKIADPSGFKLFLVASVLVSVSLVPISLSAGSTPPLAVPEPLSFRELYRIVPTGVVISFWVGCAHGTLIGIGAVYASASGLSSSDIALFLAAATVGGLALQWPIGWASDRVPRRGVMMVTALAAMVASLWLTTLDPSSFAAVVAMFLLGGTTFPLYSLGIAHTADWVDHKHLNGASAVLVRTSGIGALFGPVVAGVLMAQVDLSAFFWVVSIVHGIIAVYIGSRILVRDAAPLERQRRFVPFPARASAVVVNLIRRPLRR
jgi:MFS family permease